MTNRMHDEVLIALLSQVCEDSTLLHKAWSPSVDLNYRWGNSYAFFRRHRSSEPLEAAIKRFDCCPGKAAKSFRSAYRAGRDIHQADGSSPCSAGKGNHRL